MRRALLIIPGLLAGCVAAPPPIAPPSIPPPIAIRPAAQDPSLARDAALDGFATAIPDASRVSQRTVALPAGPVPVTGLTLPDTVFFDFGIAIPRADAAPALDNLARAIRSSPSDSLLTIAGNTDAIGTAHANQSLSEARARAVVDALAERGIDAGRLAAIGFGATRPIAPNDTDDGRAQNRRVELALSPSFAANAAYFTALVPVSIIEAHAAARPSLGRRPAPLNLSPNRPDPIQRNNLGPPVSY